MIERYRFIPDWLYYFFFLPVLAILPLRVGYLFARLQGRYFFCSQNRARQSAAKNLSRLLQRDPLESLALVRRIFELRVAEDLDVWVDLLRGNPGDRFTIEGLEHLQQALGKGRGALLMTAHFGASSTGIVGLSYQGYRLCALGNDSSRDHTMGRALRRFSALKLSWLTNRIGSQLILIQMHDQDPMAKSATARLVGHLRENQGIVMALDVPPSMVRNRLPAQFLNQKCCFPFGLVLLARLSGAPIVPFFTLRDPFCWSKHRILLQPPLPLTGNHRRDLQLCVEKLEEMVRRYPDHWNLWEAFEEFQQQGSSTDDPIDVSNPA